jgi:hypothetical protein
MRVSRAEVFAALVWRASLASESFVRGHEFVTLNLRFLVDGRIAWRTSCSLDNPRVYLHDCGTWPQNSHTSQPDTRSHLRRQHERYAY